MNIVTKKDVAIESVPNKIETRSVSHFVDKYPQSFEKKDNFEERIPTLIFGSL